MKFHILMRYGIARIIDGEPTLLSGRDQQGPITFSERSQAESHIRYEGLSDIHIVVIQLRYTLDK